MMFTLSLSLLIVSPEIFVTADETASGIVISQSLARKINAFGSDLLNELYAKTSNYENILVSPVSVYTSLAMLHLGAGPRTRDDLTSVMKLLTDGENSMELHDQLNKLLQMLVSQPYKQLLKYHETVLSNAIFLPIGYPLKASYLELTRTYYGGVVKNINFNSNLTAATDEINKWISKSTKGRITQLYDNPISADPIVILISTLYFNARLQRPLPWHKTSKEWYYLGLSHIRLQTMVGQMCLFYDSDPELRFDSVTLYFAGHDYEMNIYLQHKGLDDNSSYADIFSKLAQRNFSPHNGSLVNVDFMIPRVKISMKNSLMSALRLEKIFRAPDLSEMTPLMCTNMKISNMTHAIELEMDEFGVSTTPDVARDYARTPLIICDRRGPSVKFDATRPFMLTIMHRPSQMTLFAAIVRKPIPELFSGLVFLN